MNSVYKDLALRLKCAYVSHRLNIALTYCMKTYVVDEPIEDYYYELAKQFYIDAAIAFEQMSAAHAAESANDGPPG